MNRSESDTSRSYRGGTYPPIKESMKTSHVIAEPHILYLGTPVVLVSTVNEDGTHNLAPFRRSSGWAGGCACNRVRIADRTQSASYGRVRTESSVGGLGGQVHASPLAEIPEQADEPEAKV